MTIAETNPTAAPSDAGAGRGEFTGETGSLFNIMFKGLLLTILTLGIYRFWMKTHLRRYYWGSTRLDGEPLEYTGKGVELLLGFLIAIFFLAIYLAVVNFGLSFASMAYWQGYEPAAFLSLLTLLPLIPYAKYRAQRYLLSRTRWKGVRFGLDLEAWAYTWRSLLWSLGSIVTLGLLYPLADFKLRQFITKRMTFGDQRFELTGKAGGLYRGFIWVWALIAATVAVFVAVAVTATPPPANDPFATPEPSGPLLALGRFVYLAAISGGIWYGSFRLKYILSRMEVASHGGAPAQIISEMQPGRMTMVVIGGLFLTMLITIAFAVGMALVFGVAGAGVAAAYPELLSVFDPSLNQGDPDPATLVVIFGAVIVFYLIIGVAAVIAAEIFVNRRYIDRAIGTLRIQNVAAMSSARQQAQTEEQAAEGFADALDVGAF
ncbi:MAG: DUF898 family protein [Neomegalonema sp.]